MKPYAEDFYKSVQWQRCRQSFMQSKKYLCEMCLEQGIYTKAEIVHHKTFITPENINDVNITLNWDNLIALCREHHSLVHGAHKGRRYMVDEEGNVII